jgi:hypothetical protein
LRKLNGLNRLRRPNGLNRLRKLNGLHGSRGLCFRALLRKFSQFLFDKRQKARVFGL